MHLYGNYFTNILHICEIKSFKPNSMNTNKPLSRENYLYSMYAVELEYINKIMLFQDNHYETNGEIVILVDSDFPNFKNLDERRIIEIVTLYENKGWKIRKEAVKDRKEYLLVLS